MKWLSGIATALVLLVYGFWLLHSWELGFRESELATTPVRIAYQQHIVHLGHELGSGPCDLPICEYLTSNGLLIGNRRRLAFWEPPQEIGCTFWWWPFQDCLGLETSVQIYEHPRLRRIFDEALANPCRFLGKPSKPVPFSYPPQSAYKRFECDDGLDGNPVRIGLRLVDKDRKSLDGNVVWYEATR